jgi:hypothetical protein
LSFYRTAFTHLVAPPRGRPTVSLAALFLVWQAANAAGFLWQGWRDMTKGERSVRREATSSSRRA